MEYKKGHQFLRQGGLLSVATPWAFISPLQLALLLFCSPLHVHFKALAVSFGFKEVIGKILIESLQPLNDIGMLLLSGK